MGGSFSGGPNQLNKTASMRNDSDAGNMTKKKKWHYPP